MLYVGFFVYLFALVILHYSICDRYKWVRNGNDFEAAGSDDTIVQQQGVGTLTFNNPRKKDEGFYQCLATNDFGTAVSTTVQLVSAGQFIDFLISHTVFGVTIGHVNIELSS